jgi:uncharacterized membrane protein YeaQ/YmgE (transglycosylase-associated protein family)
MDILWMILVGAVVGVIAKLVMPGRDPGGIIVTIILGIRAAWLVVGCLPRSDWVVVGSWASSARSWAP